MASLLKLVPVGDAAWCVQGTAQVGLDNSVVISAILLVGVRLAINAPCRAQQMKAKDVGSTATGRRPQPRLVRRTPNLILQHPQPAFAWLL